MSHGTVAETQPGQSAFPPAPVRLKQRTRRILVEDGLLLGGRAARLKFSPFDDHAERFWWSLAEGTTAARLLDAAADPDIRGRHATWLRMLYANDLLETISRPADIDPDDLARFDRMLNRLSELETAGHDRFSLLRRLRGARVGIMGTGGLGSWILYNLLCYGVGGLRLIDADSVELSNLNRSILYTEQDVGRPKVEAAREAVLRFAPRTEVESVSLYVDSADRLEPRLDGLDLLIATGDQPSWLIREWISVAAYRTRIPVLHPSGGRVGPFWAPGAHTACGMCDWARLVEDNPAQPALLAAQRRLPPANPGPVSMIGTMTAGVVAMDAFRFLLGMPPFTAGRIWTLAGDLTATLAPVPPHPRCPLCSDLASSSPIPAPSGQARLR